VFEPPTPQHDIRGAKNEGRHLYDKLERDAARRSELGIQRPKLRDSVRRFGRWITRRKPAE
jgi:hypothetical protein